MNRQSLKICSIDRTPICELWDNTEYRVRNVVEKLAINEIEVLSFDLPVSNPKWTNIKNENLVFFKDEYFKIKSASFRHEEDGRLYVAVECKHYSDNLANDLISIEEITPRNVVDLMKIALCYDENGNPTKGWTVGQVTVDRVAKRGLEVMEQSPFSILLTIAEKYSGILKFNSKTMTVDMLAAQNTEHPTLDLRVSKNLKNFEISYDTTEMYTRLYCFGATDDNGNELDIMEVNPTGKPYVENFEYFYKLGYSEEYVAEHPELFVNTNIWRDDNYYDVHDLYNDGIKELAKIAQPVVNVKVTALDMAVASDGNIIEIPLGACIKVTEEDLGVDTLCNVVSRTINYEEPHILNCEVTNSVVYHDTLSKLFTNVSTASSVVTSGGNLVGGMGTSMNDVAAYLNTYYLNAEQIEATYVTAGDLKTHYLTAEEIQTQYLDAEAIGANYATIGSLNAIEAQIQDLDVDVINAKLAEVDTLVADTAELRDLFATDAEIESLKADNVTVAGKLAASVAEIDTIKSTYVQVGSFEAYRGTVENLFATNAEIESLKTKYIDALSIETNEAKIQQLQANIAKIEELQASMAAIESLVSKSIVTDDLDASKATIDSLDARIASIGTAIINIAKVEDLQAANAQITNLNAEHINAVQASVDELTAKSATISQLTAYTLKSEFGEFQNLTAENLKAANASIGSLDANVANINSVLAGNIGTGLLQTVHLTADNVVIDDAVIKSANIESIDTDVVTVGNDNIILSGSTQQFKDADGNVRIQIGLDAEDNFTFIVADEDGATVIDADGITKNAVPDGLIVDKMVANNAAIQASKIQYTDTDGNTTLQTHLETEQGRINALIRETTITNSDGTTTSIKDKYLDIDATVDGLKTTISDVSTDVDNMSSRVTQVEATANGLNIKVNSIGGQNLFYHTTRDWLSKTDGEDYIYLGCYKETTDNDMEGKNVTLSFEVDASANTSGTFDICYYTTSSPTTADIVTLFEGISLEDVADGVYQKTFVYPATSSVVRVDDTIPMFTVVIRVSNIVGNLQVRKGMLQYGLLATQWQPTTDNVEEAASEAYIAAGKIEWVVKSGTDATNFTLTPRTAELVAEQINMKGLVTFSGLNSSVPEEILSTFANEPAAGSTTVIHGGYIQTGTIGAEQINTEELVADAAFVNALNAVEINADRITSGTIQASLLDLYNLRVTNRGDSNLETLYISDQGDITLRGSMTSYDYVTGESGWSIQSNGDVELNNIVARGRFESADGGITDDEATDNSPAIRAWFGTTYENRENAPTIIYSDGTIKTNKGEFGGVFTGDIKIGNISITDPSKVTGNDAILTIQHGDTGVNRVQLRDTDASSFAQDVIITDNFENSKIQLKQEGTIIANHYSAGNSWMNADGLSIQGSLLTGTSTSMTIISNAFNVGTMGAESTLNVWGNATINSNSQFNGEMHFSDVVAISTLDDGLNFDFISSTLSYTVIFETNGGSVIAAKTEVPAGTKIVAPTNPTKAGYVFDGWYQDALFNVPFNFSSDVINRDTILYAKWVAYIPSTPTYRFVVPTNNNTSFGEASVWSGPFTCDASAADGGTLSYRWRVNLYEGSQMLLAISDVFATKATNNITIDELKRYLPMTGGYEMLQGYVEITNTKNGATTTISTSGFTIMV